MERLCRTVRLKKKDFSFLLKYPLIKLKLEKYRKQIEKTHEVN